jgi:methanogenesis imperfect marker protein 11
VIGTKVIGNTIRYLCRADSCDLNLEASHAAGGIKCVEVHDGKVEITYAGLGGGGVGATSCRAMADGVLAYDISESGGGKVGSGTITVPRRSRLIVGIDDTDSKEVGATWCLAHNIASLVDCEAARYLSHSIVQLYPVPAKTQNCVSTALEFACMGSGAEQVLAAIRDLLTEYSVSDETGMVSLSGFDGSALDDYGRSCKSRVLTREYALECARVAGTEVWLDGNGVIGALGAIPYVAMPDESVAL